ncbi:MAG: molecular chaperone SurA [Methylococcaceae bacterium]|nr:molecular chaperone SurA [Methylococcaceae bacterium]
MAGFVLAALFNLSSVNAEDLDFIVAIVENDVVLNSELQTETAAIVKKLKANKVDLPPDNILKGQVLERIIVDKLQRHLAKTSGINVTNEMLQAAVKEIAQRNNMNAEQFKQQLQSQKINYKDFEENIRHEIAINQVRAHEIGGQIKVSDSEVEHALETQGEVTLDKSQYHLGHILIAIPEAASSEVIQKAKRRAEEVVAKLRDKADFNKTAVETSDDAQALQGGDLGWRTLAQMPTIFVDVAAKMAAGDISEPIRSPSGFHIIKLHEFKGLSKVQSHILTKTNVRHILIKTNELVDDNEAKRRLMAIKTRITDGDDFAALARAQSDDKGSALKGGGLDWVVPGAMVPEFEKAMDNLKVNELSNPVQTQFGWHLIQVLERKQQDDTSEFKKNQVRDAIRERKIEEETELWLRRLRDEAYVEIFKDRL